MFEIDEKIGISEGTCCSRKRVKFKLFQERLCSISRTKMYMHYFSHESQSFPENTYILKAIKIWNQNTA